ncbi:oligosaccharide flippase family protein [Tamlana fucoidanivorans]|uniref:oligosaccharide flippase family protein n=1 Tax=Allotamlana fucoidanivorans TaxID=2583814 RepID=UPI0013054814|nr:oligosaccharide flippase family protein [Tamlana fucoidanivorans]
MDDNKNSYGQILKATSLFGGVKIFNILISIIKTKLVTILIGASGFGILALFNSTINMLVNFTKLGLDTSAVKEISQRNHDSLKVNEFIGVLNRVIWISGILGGVITILFSKSLSIWTFGTATYKFAFVWLSVAILFNQLANGKMTILQGTRQLKKLAKANVLGSFLSLVFTVPLYYFLGTEGIVPAVIVSFVVIYIVLHFYSKDKTYSTEALGIKKLFKESKSMLTLGLTMSYSSLLAALVAWVIQIYIRNEGGVQEVGFYNAGFLIINAYVGMVFSAMATDYFPRLSEVHSNTDLINSVVSKQADVAMLLITPIITLFLLFRELIIHVLFTKEFIVVIGMMTYGIIGMLFKAFSFSMGYVIIARGDSKLYVKTASLFNLLMLIICLAFYSYGGLTWLGAGLMVYYLIHLLGIAVVTKYFYGLQLFSKVYKTFIVCLLLSILALICTFISNSTISILLGALITISSVLFTLLMFNKRMNIKGVLLKFLKKKNN